MAMLAGLVPQVDPVWEQVWSEAELHQLLPVGRIALQEAGLFQKVTKQVLRKFFYTQKLDFASHTWIKNITQGISKKVPAQHKQYQYYAGPNDNVPIFVEAGDVVTSKGEDLTPIGVADFRADPKEG